MAIFLRIDLNLVTILLLSIVFLIANRRLDRKDTLNRSYLLSILVVMVLLGAEAFTVIINGLDGIYILWLGDFLHVILFGVAPVLSVSWFFLVMNFVTIRKKMPPWMTLMIIIPVLINGVFSLLSPFLGLYFSFDANNVYSRGPWFMISMGITYGYMFLALIHIIRLRTKILFSEFVLLFMFILMPVIGALFQALFYGVLLAWSSAGFALIIGYIFLQERLIHLDNLTGAWTRKSFDYYMEKRLKQRTIDPFGGIFFDIDHLKMINDEFGHQTGDEAINEVVSRIRGLLKEGEVLARLGGDEFIIITENRNERLKNLVDDIKLSLSVFNEAKEKPYVLSCSFGYGLFSDDFKSMDQFLRYIDQRMYDDKRHIQKEDLV